MRHMIHCIRWSDCWIKKRYRLIREVDNVKIIEQYDWNNLYWCFEAELFLWKVWRWGKAAKKKWNERRTSKRLFDRNNSKILKSMRHMIHCIGWSDCWIKKRYRLIREVDNVKIIDNMTEIIYIDALRLIYPYGKFEDEESSEKEMKRAQDKYEAIW